MKPEIGVLIFIFVLGLAVALRVSDAEKLAEATEHRHHGEELNVYMTTNGHKLPAPGAIPEQEGSTVSSNREPPFAAGQQQRSTDPVRIRGAAPLPERAWQIGQVLYEPTASEAVWLRAWFDAHPNLRHERIIAVVAVDEVGLMLVASDEDKLVIGEPVEEGGPALMHFVESGDLEGSAKDRWFR